MKMGNRSIQAVVARGRQRGQRIRRRVAILTGPALTVLGPVLLLTGHLERIQAAICILLGLGTVARDLEKAARKRGRLRAIQPVLYLISRTLFLLSEVVRINDFIFGRLPALLFSRGMDTEPTTPLDWDPEAGLKVRGYCVLCGHEILTNMPHCPACGALLRADNTRIEQWFRPA